MNQGSLLPAWGTLASYARNVNCSATCECEGLFQKLYFIREHRFKNNQE